MIIVYQVVLIPLITAACFCFYKAGYWCGVEDSLGPQKGIKKLLKKVKGE